MVDPLDAVSPLDGRYADETAPLRSYASEAALARSRVHVEVEYLLALGGLEVTPFTVDEEVQDRLRDLYQSFDADAATRVKQYEVDGVGDRPPTHHDVKAVEYYVQDQVPAKMKPWVHFGLTSEDINNLARRLMIRGAIREVLLPAVADVRDELVAFARTEAETVMPARTHGQAASPTTFGKEMAVFAARLTRAMAGVRRADDGLSGKLAGATGTYAAHTVAVPEVDWPSFAEEFVTDLGFRHVAPVTQVNPGDDLATVFHTLQEVNGVLLDCARDCWQYTSDGFLRPTDVSGVGSSTMPHKVNPIDFENAEGNLEKAGADLDFLARYLQTSRLQRDLSDSTVKRTIGPAFAHCLVAYGRLADGLADVEPDAPAMESAVEASPEVLAEAVQTVLRREGMTDAYERVAEATQGEHLTLEDIHRIVTDLDIPEAARSRLTALTPRDYVGEAPRLADNRITDE